MKSKFLNVDLELLSRKRLKPFADELGDRVLVLYSGRPPAGWARSSAKGYFLSLEYSGLYFSRSPDSIIHALCSIIEKMSPGAKKIWNEAEKVFDIGYELHPQESRLECVLKARTIERIASLGATIGLTCYRGKV